MNTLGLQPAFTTEWLWDHEPNDVSAWIPTFLICKMGTTPTFQECAEQEHMLFSLQEQTLPPSSTQHLTYESL